MRNPTHDATVKKENLRQITEILPVTTESTQAISQFTGETKSE